jgi:hypothetical protein
MSDLLGRMHVLACDIDDQPTGAFTDEDAMETLAFLRESCAAAERAVVRLFGREEFSDS